jgi:hypothetical protein
MQTQKRSVKKKMKIIKINAKESTIKEVDAPEEEYGIMDTDWMCKEIGCTMFTTVRLSSGDYLFVDDEGLLRSGFQPAFQLDEYPQALVGNGLVVGANEDGSSAVPIISIDELKEKIKFGIIALETPESVNN